MFETTWKTDTEYLKGAQVLVYGRAYECLADHKSNIFADDLFGKSTEKKTLPVVWTRVTPGNEKIVMF